MKRILSLSFLLICAYSLNARDWYVTGKGSDKNDGWTEQSARRTLQSVADEVNPGDVVYIGDGIYTSDDKEGVLRIFRSGTRQRGTNAV